MLGRVDHSRYQAFMWRKSQKNYVSMLQIEKSLPNFKEIKTENAKLYL